MKNEIRLVEEKKKKNGLKIRKYEGHGFLMTVQDDGLLKTVSVQPFDPVYGCQVSGLEFGQPYIHPPEFALADLWRLENSISNAKNFCEEFLKRKEEF